MGSQNDEAWSRLFENYDILSQIDRRGVFEIDAVTIKTVREPRLMSKFDHRANLPEIFRKHELAILPISRSRYVIGRFRAYHDRPEIWPNTPPASVPFPDYLHSIDPANLYSETAVLHCAYATGIIDDVIGEPSWPTISGRMSSGDFDFWIVGEDARDYPLAVSKSQIEIDGGYEAASRVMLIEAKNESVRDFLIRQIYYPYRLWAQKLTKAVLPVFLTFSNDVFTFSVYAFDDPSRYNSLSLVEERRYVLAHEGIHLRDLMYLLARGDITPEPKIPFPQADVFSRVVDLLGILMQSDRDREEITANYGFDIRQTHYYTAAGMYLGLVERYHDQDRAVVFRLTATGRKIMRQSYKAKYLMLAQRILEHAVFRRVIEEELSHGQPMPLDRIVEMMKASHLYQVEAESTFGRRAQTVAAWAQWVLNLRTG